MKKKTKCNDILTSIINEQLSSIYQPNVDLVVVGHYYLFCFANPFCGLLELF